MLKITNMSCIDAHSLYKTYHNVIAVNGINLKIDQGQIFGFLGPNGAGKSTIIKLLTTLISPDNGSIHIMGIDAIKNPLKIRQKIGVVLQQPSYEPNLSVEKSLDKYGMMWNVESKIRKKKIEQILYDFELADIRKKKNEDLSIGQRRRVQVAREFMHEMELLFLDEPTVGLDPGARRKLLNFLKNQVKQSGLTIFYTTHVLSEAEYLCDNIAIINHGKILAIDSPNQLKNRFGNEKIIKINISNPPSNFEQLFSTIPDCQIESGLEPIIIIKSFNSEIILMKILKILNENKIHIDNLSAIPTNLEEIFLRVIGDSTESNH